MKVFVSKEGRHYIWLPHDHRFTEVTEAGKSQGSVSEYVDSDGKHWQVSLVRLPFYDTIVLARPLGSDEWTYDGINSGFEVGMAWDVISIFDCAKYLKRTVQAVHKMASSDRLKSQRLGNSLYITGKSARALHQKMYGEI